MRFPLFKVKEVVPSINVKNVNRFGRSFMIDYLFVVLDIRITARLLCEE